MTEFILHNGQNGRDSYLAGTDYAIIQMQLWYQFRDLIKDAHDEARITEDQFGYLLVQGVQSRKLGDEWVMRLNLNDTGLTDLERDIIHQFIVDNETVLGVYVPDTIMPSLINPTVSFVKIAVASVRLVDMLDDLDRRGLQTVTGTFVGDDYVVFDESSFTASQRNRLTNSWEDRLEFE